MVLGIDIGGTSLKFGVINAAGEIVAHKRYETDAFVKNGFEKSLADAIGEFLVTYPDLQGVGMGYPGLLSADRRAVLFLPNIPAVRNVYIVDYLAKVYPKLKVKIENDAKCAALGEYQFGANKGQDNFICVTLGTGVGSGAIINGQLFIGARGNGTEIGHMLIGNGKTLENHIGLASILSYAKDSVDKLGGVLAGKEITMHALCAAANEGDKAAKEVFSFVGRMLGENLVSVIRVLDLDCVIIGGGISNGFQHILPELEGTLVKYLPEYYTKDIKIKQASLVNDAGLLGAAGLIMIDSK